MIKNSSMHNLNADNGLSKSKKIVWLLLNFINNKLLPNRSSGLCVKNFCPKLDEEDWGKIHEKSSPGRALSDLFWSKLDWKAIKSELGSVNVFDTGAGSGGYALKLNDFAGGISGYFGADFTPHTEWEKLMREFDFITLKEHKSDDILNIIPKETNFFMSQSAIEHFENDLLYFQQIRRFIEKTKNNTVQIHLFPSAACLRLYLWHGVRQYNQRTVSKIVQLFDSPNSYSVLYRLGGHNCNKLHRKYITYPWLIRKVPWVAKKDDLKFLGSEEYRDLLKKSVNKDIAQNNNDPNFYALVIHSNFNVPVFS